MSKSTINLAVAIIAAGSFSAAFAAGPALGIATANGNFLINNSKVSGNATLTDGAVIETTGTPSSLRLNDGARIDLSGNAKARVYQDRLVLEAGFGDLSSPGEYQIEAGSLRISPATADTSGRVVRHGEKAVQVAAATGTLRVYNAGGILIANVVPGTALEFEPQVAGAAPPSTFLGCLLKKQGKFVLYDQTTRIVVELRGTGFEREWGNRVQVIGTTDTSAQSDVGAQVVDVTSVTRFGEGGCGPVAQAISGELPPTTTAGRPAAPPRPAPSGGGMSAGTKVAIVAAAPAPGFFLPHRKTVPPDPGEPEPGLRYLVCPQLCILFV